MSKPYRTYANSTVAHVLAFFERNPGEELTRSDVCVKFGIAPTSVAGTLAAAVDAGLVCWERTDEGRWVYRASQAERDEAGGSHG